MVDGSSPFSRSMFLNVSRLLSKKAQKQTRPASRFSTSHQTTSRTLKDSIAERSSTLRTLQQARRASLVAAEAEARTGAERTLVREHRTGAEAQAPAKIARRANRSRLLITPT
ncbi:MAG TPA: hypothetical protein VER96_18755 [Polyangiaceae bacterium]|nr:hypothetical protein [Polyangiaceae bacterium]